MKLAVPSTLCVLCMLLFIGCPAPPPVTVTLPGAGACNGKVTSTVTASIAPDTNLRPKLTIEVCVFCAGTPMAGVTGITGAIVSEIPLPPNIPANVAFGPTNASGCVTKSFINSGSTLRGQSVTVTVVDTNGATIETKTVTIK